MTSVSLKSEATLTHVASESAIQSVALTPYRVVVGFVLGSLLWNSYTYPAVFAGYKNCQLTDEFFPALLTSPYVLAVFLLTALMAGIFALFTRNVILLRIQAVTMLVCMLGLCIHQGSYNDATFATCFWVSAWCTWFTLRIEDPPERLMANAKLFAMLVLSMIFLGGAVGKMTPGYWSGEVFYQIYFADRDFWCFNLLRNLLEPETLRDVATYYSRMVIVVESACVIIWLFPAKFAGGFMLSVLLCLTLFSNLHLFSVTLCLMGLCLFTLHDRA